MSDEEDLELVQRFQCGDVTAFDALVNKYQGKVYDIVYFHIRNVEDTYDLSQEVFLRVFRSLSKFKRKSSFYTWLYKIAINACIDYARQNSRVQTIPIEEWALVSESSASESANYASSPTKALELQELKSQIAKAIDQLPPKQRAVFIMKRHQGLSLEEIAKILNRSVGTVKAHLSHATAKLANLLEPYLE